MPSVLFLALFLPKQKLPFLLGGTSCAGMVLSRLPVLFLLPLQRLLRFCADPSILYLLSDQPLHPLGTDPPLVRSGC